MKQNPSVVWSSSLVSRHVRLHTALSLSAIINQCDPNAQKEQANAPVPCTLPTHPTIAKRSKRCCVQRCPAPRLFLHPPRTHGKRSVQSTARSPRRPFPRLPWDANAAGLREGALLASATTLTRWLRQTLEGVRSAQTCNRFPSASPQRCTRGRTFAASACPPRPASPLAARCPPRCRPR